EESRWTDQECRHPEAHAVCPQLVPPWGDGDRAGRNPPVHQDVHEWWKWSLCTGDRWVTGPYHDGQRSWHHLAQPEENHCGGVGRGASSCRNGPMGSDGPPCIPSQFHALNPHVVLHGGRESLQIASRWIGLEKALPARVSPLQYPSLQ